MSSKFEPDLSVDTNISHTTFQDNVTPSQNSLINLLKNACSCTLKDIFHSKSGPIDITDYSTKVQVQILDELISKRFTSVCFTEDDDTITIKCFLNCDREICFSNWTVTEEESSTFKSQTSQISVDLKLRLAHLVKDQKYIEDFMEQAPNTIPESLLFYGISCGDIVNILVEKGANVNARDKRGRTPLFYAITSSSDSTEKLLDKGAYVIPSDKCGVSVLRYFVENMMKNNLPAPIKDEGIRLLASKGLTQEMIIKEVTNLILCKFFQTFAGDNHLDRSILCKTLRWILGQNDGNDQINALINHLQCTPSDNSFQFDAVRPLFDILHELRANPSCPDSEGNTCLHYAIRLLFHGVPQQTVTRLFHKLMELDAKLDAKNHKNETPLLFCLSSKYLIAESETCNWSKSLHIVCQLLVKEGSELRNTTHKEESVFHLILIIFQHALLLQNGNQKRCIFEEMFNILEFFSNKVKPFIVNKGDEHQNSPLHLWASLALATADQYGENVFNDQSFENLLKKILDLLIKCGSKLDAGNEKEEKPLHKCRTWTAVKLLLEAGADPAKTDSSGCTPLITAAMRNTCLENGANRFYPDVTEEPKEFWKEILERKIDLWTLDKNGDSVLSILIEKEAVHLAKALIDVACEKNQDVESDEIGIPLLATICRDASPDKGWKFDLVETLVSTKRSLVNGTLNNETPLRVICSNIVKLSDESVVKTSVQWKILQYLRKYGADVTDDDRNICSTLNFPFLNDFLSKPVDYSKIPLSLTWDKSSKTHAEKLALVAIEVYCKHVNTLYFSKEALDKDKGSLGLVFVGIFKSSSSINDGREVAVKCINKSNTPNKSASDNVLLSSDNSQCEQIVRYLCCEEDNEYHYIAFELMEGNLEDYAFSSSEDTNKLCQHVLKGLQFLHCKGIVHGNINPTTVLYKNQPNLCLKIGNCKVKKRVRGWTAPELLQVHTPNASEKSDMFSCGLVFHYLLSAKKHPFAPVDFTTKPKGQVLIEIDSNITKNNIVKLDDSLSPEAIDLVQMMLDNDANNRPSAEDALVHPFFWDTETKKRFLHIVGNEPEIAKQEKTYPLTAFEAEIENRFCTVVTESSEWNDGTAYSEIQNTYAGMRVKTKYNYCTVAGLIRFIRNAYEHINEQSTEIQNMWKNDFVLNDYFPHLVIEVYKALTRSELHQLHKSREEIKKFFNQLK